MRLTRRGLLVAGAAAAAAPSAEAARRPRRSRRSRRADVVVVGAGLAGLRAAELVRAAGRSVVVLEARGRVGGRTHTLHAGDPALAMDVGGQWVGPTQDHVISLAREHGVKTFPVHIAGEHVYDRAGTRITYPTLPGTEEIPPDPEALPEILKAVALLDQYATEVPIEAPWTAARAAEWDSQTVASWVRENVADPQARRLLDDVGIPAVFAAESRDLSFLYLLAYIRGAGDERNVGTIERLLGTANGAQQQRFEGGAQLVSMRMAQRLGRRVVLRSPVRRIDHGAREVQVRSDRLTVRARHVIVAVPPALVAQIRFEPGLPAARAQLHQRFPQGNVIKAQAIYERPFWRDAGLSGFWVADRGPVRVGWDNSPPDGSRGVLLTFFEGQEARAFGERTQAERRAAVLDAFAFVAGDQARSPTGYVDEVWANEVWTRGCYVAFTPPGVLTGFGPAISAAVGRVHWAGADTATYWRGYMDGAVRSGERAAAECLESL